MKTDNNSVVFNIGWSVVERLSSQIVYFATSVILARLIAPEIYGIAMMATVIINIFAVAIPSGFSSALIYMKRDDRLAYSTAFWATLFMTGFLYILLFSAAPLIAKYYSVPSIATYIRVAAIQLVLQGAQSIPFASISKHMRFKVNYAATLVGVIASACTSILLAISGLGVWALLLGTSVEVFVATIAICLLTGFRIDLKIDFSLAKQMFFYCWKLMGVDSLNALYSSLNSLIIGKMFRASDVAYYTRAYNMPQMLLGSVTTAVSKVLFPVFSNRNDSREVRPLLRKSIRSMNFIVFPLLAGLAAVGYEVVVLLYTEKWIEAVPYLYVMCLVWAFQPVQICAIQAFKALGKTDIYFRLEIYKKIIGLAVILLFILWIRDPMALALSLVANQAISAVINMPVMKKYLGYSYLDQAKDMLESAPLSLLMLCLVYASGLMINNIPLQICIQVFVGVFVYALLSQVTGNEQFRYMKSVLKNVLRTRSN